MKAFPIIDYINGESSYIYQEKGMDLRDYFAAKIIPCVFDNSTLLFEDKDYQEAAKISYKIADAMMKAREA